MKLTKNPTELARILTYKTAISPCFFFWINMTANGSHRTYEHTGLRMSGIPSCMLLVLSYHDKYISIFYLRWSLFLKYISAHNTCAMPVTLHVYTFIALVHYCMNAIILEHLFVYGHVPPFCCIGRSSNYWEHVLSETTLILAIACKLYSGSLQKRYGNSKNLERFLLFLCKRVRAICMRSVQQYRLANYFTFFSYANGKAKVKGWRKLNRKFIDFI